MARRSARALVRLAANRIALAAILTPHALENAMLVHAAFGGSTNLLLHIPALAHAAGLARPTVGDWTRVNRATPRLVDALPNGPLDHPTVQVFMAGGVPEVMLHLREMGLLNLDVLTVTGETLGAVLDWWESSERRQRARARLQEADNVDPDRVIMGPDAARRAGLTRTVDLSRRQHRARRLGRQGHRDRPVSRRRDDVYRHRGPARVFTSEADAIAAIKGRDARHPGQAGRRGGADRRRPARHRDGGDLPAHVGAQVSPLGQDRRHRHRRAFLRRVDRRVRRPRGTRGAGGRADRQTGRRRRDRDRHRPQAGRAGNSTWSASQIATSRRTKPRGCWRGGSSHPGLRPHPDLPADTRLWAALQQASGGTWAGCVYDVDRIVDVINAGLEALEANEPQSQFRGRK